MEAEGLKEVRKKFAITQKTMAKALNTPLKTYQKWEQGTRRIPGIVPAAILLLTYFSLKKSKNTIDDMFRVINKLKDPTNLPTK